MQSAVLAPGIVRWIVLCACKHGFHAAHGRTVAPASRVCACARARACACERGVRRPPTYQRSERPKTTLRSGAPRPPVPRHPRATVPTQGGWWLHGWLGVRSAAVAPRARAARPSALRRHHDLWRLPRGLVGGDSRRVSPRVPNGWMMRFGPWPSSRVVSAVVVRRGRRVPLSQPSAAAAAAGASAGASPHARP